MTAHDSFHELIRGERERRGWSQVELAEKLRCDAKTVGRWERGESAPQPLYRQRLAELFGKSVEELGLIPEAPFSDQLAGEEQDPGRPAPSTFPRADWGEAPHMVHLYGRDEEWATLEQWMSDPGCCIGLILGLGGAGKTALAVTVAARVQPRYDLLFWRTLQNPLPFEHFLRQCLEFLAPQSYIDLPKEVDEQISLLMASLRAQRCLLVLDNFETLLQTGDNMGLYRAEYAAYGRLLRRVGETQHRSFLLVTSREKPRDIAHLESVRSFSLAGLGWLAGQRLLSEKGLLGAEQDWQTLIESYMGNPLALRLVADYIQEVFAGDIASFLKQETIAFGGIHDLLLQHFQRLSAREQELLYWLAIEREPASMEDLNANLAYPVLSSVLIEALASLRRRSLIELQGAARFSLQPVILEYVTGTLIERADAEFETTPQGVWSQFALVKAHAKEYVRASQERFLLAPLAQCLLLRLGQAGLTRKIRVLLEEQRRDHLPQSGYLAGNMLNLLNFLHCDMRGFDFSDLVIRQAYLQGALLPEVQFARARFVETLFTGAFGNVQAVACNPQGTLFAAGTASGEIRIYEAATYTLRVICHKHTDGVWFLAFSPDGAMLASCSDDHMIRLWDSRSGSCLNLLEGHTSRVRALAFHPAGHVLVSGSDDATLRLWDVRTGQCHQVLSGHTGRVWSLAFQRQGRLFASGSTDQTVRLWDFEKRVCLRILSGHSNAIRSVVFHPEAELLASGSDDQTVRLWEVESGECRKTLAGHTNRVWSLAFDARGEVLASASEDQTIHLWRGASGESLGTLAGHSQGVRSVAFLPGQSVLVSGGDDQTIRAWDISTGNCLQTVQGYTVRVLSLAFSADSSMLVTGSEDSALRLWERATDRYSTLAQDRRHRILAVAFAPDNLRIASGGQDQTVRVWERQSGRCRLQLEGHTNWVRTVNFSPDGRYLASGGEDRTIRVWDTLTATCLHELPGHTSWVRSVVFSPDGQTLASCGDDAMLRLWRVSDGQCLAILPGHANRVRAIVFSPDGRLLASSSEDQSIILWDIAARARLTTLKGFASWMRSVAFNPNGQVLAGGSEDGSISFWDVPTWQRQRTFQARASRVRQLAFSPDGQALASCSDDGSVSFWESHTATCFKTLISERPYERMNITGALGLTAAQKVSLEMLGAIEEA